MLPVERSPYSLAWRLSLPVLFAYLPLGIVFGLMSAQLQEPWYFAPLMSVVLYAGAVQFIAIGLMAVHAPYLTIFLSTVFVALRNAFYGISLQKRFDVSWPTKLYLIYGLVDASYAILLTTPSYEDPAKDKKFCVILTTLLCVYWVSGSLIGALFAEKLAGLEGLEFVLIAFFVVLVLEQYLKYQNISTIVIALIACAIGYALFSMNMLLPAIGICCLIFIFKFYWSQYRA